MTTAGCHHYRVRPAHCWRLESAGTATLYLFHPTMSRSCWKALAHHAYFTSIHMQAILSRFGVASDPV